VKKRKRRSLKSARGRIAARSQNTRKNIKRKEGGHEWRGGVRPKKVNLRVFKLPGVRGKVGESEKRSAERQARLVRIADSACVGQAEGIGNIPSLSRAGGTCIQKLWLAIPRTKSTARERAGSKKGNEHSCTQSSLDSCTCLKKVP